MLRLGYLTRDAAPSGAVVVPDQRGIGLSDKPQDGYDSATLANDMVALMDALGYRRFALYGTDVGMPIAYALAADHRDRVDRLTVSEARYQRAEPAAPRTAADPARAGDRRSGKLRRRRREHDEARGGRRADPDHPRLRPLGRRAGSRAAAHRAVHVPGSLPGRDSRGAQLNTSGSH